ncbi:hypothetical protein [Cryobacterium sp. TMT4-31]|uniref:hypothetical protein n=1 Tax=Cryobacterium sp. TMT4-31 TaxID=1259259 RepID=UPI00106A7524|nr:hypothetical protein [Cryobacterium sp. TMT4-31]TFC91454.1 hypothetical protein E3T19_03955 [Cryobacterium sp. TMT4-31]
MADSRPEFDRGDTTSGFTLIELLIYISMMVIVLVIVGGVLINSLATQRTVRNATQASNAGQLVAESIGQGVRNASALALTTPSPGTQLLTVRTASMATTPVWRCQAWYFGGGEVRTKTSSLLISATDFDTWTLLGDGMNAVSGVPIVSLTPVSTPVPGPAPPPPAPSRGIILTLDVSTVDGEPVRINNAVSSLQPLPVPVPVTGLVGLPCF